MMIDDVGDVGILVTSFAQKMVAMVTGWGMKLEVKRPEGLFPVLPLTRCDLSQITSPLCASVFLFVQRVIMLPPPL